MYLYRVALIVAIAAIACEASWADTQYKTAMMDTHMENYDRTKRSLENTNIEQINPNVEADEETKQIMKREDGFDYSTLMDPAMMDTSMMDSMMIDSESHGQQKRQLFRPRYYNPLSYGYPYNRYRPNNYYRRYTPTLSYSPLEPFYGRLNRYPYY